jgi:hypothetical protein
VVMIMGSGAPFFCWRKRQSQHLHPRPMRDGAQIQILGSGAPENGLPGRKRKKQGDNMKLSPCVQTFIPFGKAELTCGCSALQ